MYSRLSAGMEQVVFFLSLSVLLLNLSNAICVSNNGTLVLLQIISRHGERSPISLYPKDPTPTNFWHEGLGQLTMRGRRQQYALGKLLHTMYRGFITTSPNEVTVNSTQDERCLMSAESNLASFYAPSEEWKFEQVLNWQPIPVHYVSKKDDMCLDFMSYCPRADAEIGRLLKSPENREFLAKHKNMLKHLTDCSGATMNNLWDPYLLHDTLFIQKNYNLTIPSCFDPFWDELDNFAAVVFRHFFNSHLLHRLRAGPFLKYVIEQMHKNLAGDKRKVLISFSHDINIGVVLDALKLFTKQPPFCASLIFELHVLANGMEAVRLLYLNSTRPEKGTQTPHVLKLDGCDEFCPLEHFKYFTKKFLPDNWHKECQLNNSVEKYKDDASQ